MSVLFLGVQKCFANMNSATSVVPQAFIMLGDIALHIYAKKKSDVLYKTKNIQ